VVPWGAEQSYAKPGLRHFLYSSPIALAIVTTATLAIAHGEDATPAKDSPSAASPTVAPAADKGVTETPKAAEEEEKTKLPWHGSVLLFDQSVTTQTVGLGKNFQSADNVYEWWLAFKPKYYVYESKRSSFSVGAWANLYLEMTNSDTTTTSQEPVLGPTWLTAPYSFTPLDRNEYKLTLTLGPRITLPTEQASRNAGMIIGLGASGGVTQSFPIAGKSARSFNGGRFGVAGVFDRPMYRATTRVYSNLNQAREDVAGRTISSDQLGGGMNAKYSARVAFSGALQITPKLEFGLSYVIWPTWSYTPKDVPICVALTGCGEPQRVNDPQTFKVSTWGIVSLDYEATDELAVGLGYYNLAAQIGPDGQRRNPLWSPDARLFFTLTGNLDAIYERVATKPSPTQTASAKP
jgi:hypothetical protein